MKRSFQVIGNDEMSISGLIIIDILNEKEIKSGSDDFIADFKVDGNIDESIKGLKINHPNGYECLIIGITQPNIISVHYSKNPDFKVHSLI